MAHLRTGDAAALTATMRDHVGTKAAAITTACGFVMLDGATNDWVQNDA